MPRMDTEKGAYGRVLRERRKHLRMTQEVLAERVGTNRSHLAQIETGRIRFPEAELRAQIAKALGSTDGELLRLAGVVRVPEESDPEPLASVVGDLPDDPRARLAELLPLLDDRQARYLAVHVEFVLGLRD